MAKRTNLSLTLRQRELKKLIKDAEELGFSKDLVNSYKSQLAEVEEELKQIKMSRKRFKEVEE